MEYINMDKRFKISKILIANLIFLLLFALLIPQCWSFGYDSSSSSCSPNTKQSRRGRAQMLAAIPCDLLTQAYCTQPGSAYPWHAVRRFVHENQGLMKRMYGDVRHISVLREEIYNNEIDIDDIEAATERYSRDGYNRRASKLMHHREDFDNFKVNERVNDILRDPHFRPVSTTTTTATSRKTTTTEPPATTLKTSTTEDVESTVMANDEETTTLASSTASSVTTTTKGTTPKPNDVTNADLNTTNDEEEEDGEKSINDTTKSSKSKLFENQINPDEEDDDDMTTSSDREDDLDVINIEVNSVFEETGDDVPPTELTGDNIEIVPSPQLGLRNLTTEIPSTTPPSKTDRTTTEAAVTTTTSIPNTSSAASTTGGTTRRTKTTETTTTAATTTTQKPEIVAERSPIKKERKPFVPSSTRLHQRPQQQQQGQKAESTISAKLKLKINPTQATPTKVTSSSTTTMTHMDKASLNATTLTTPLTSMKTSPFKSHYNKNFNRYTTTHHHHQNNNNNKYNVQPSAAPPVATSTPTQPNIKPNADLLLGEKIRRTGVNITPPSVASNKPIIKEGQLFQDTMKQEQPAPVLNVKGVNACPVKEEVVAPFWANNTRGEVLALLNLYPFEQYVHWEKCTHEHKQMYCREGCRCEQQYRLHRLLAYDPHNECRGIFSDWFRFPSCCICKCYNIPLDFRATSRSPRSEGGVGGGSGGEDYRHPIDIAEEQVKNAIYEHATEDWYRPKDDFDFYEG
ncbi:protein spaetzle 4 [Musca domestica]|uniref:Protein spaetzle 4 n=1 Tax=Musca domestica TaxID=7370 RepID=A0A1I8NHW5_MUSDO|nr:protein spaetzle 4 [Musca domestica]